MKSQSRQQQSNRQRQNPATPVPFAKVVKRQGLRRYLLPFTFFLMVFAITALTTISS
jgi:hypothetical protein